MLKRIIGGAVAFALTAMLVPAGTAWADEPPAQLATTRTEVSVDGPPGAVPGSLPGEFVDVRPGKTISAAGGHIRISGGWYYTIPVNYVYFDWTYTWRLKTLVDDNRSSIPGVLCGYLPSTAAKTACSAVWVAFRSDVINTINAAIAHRKCYKVRLPLTAGGASLAAYDSYYVTC